MPLDSKEIILRRLSRELSAVETVFLGPGLPQQVCSRLSPDVRCLDASSNGFSGDVDVVVVEAQQVTPQGDLVLGSEDGVFRGSGRRWIVATTHTDSEGRPRLVKSSRFPIAMPGRVDLVITEMGVIEVSEVGLVLREVAPGYATDDVKMKTNASLHVADDIRSMDLA